MIISDMNKMEDIVSNNPSLSWDGWNVVHLVKSNDAMFKNNGSFIDGNWYSKTVYTPNENGWNIKQSHLEK